MQTAIISLGPTEVHVNFPSPTAQVVPGVIWGEIAAFPSPAYWAYQVIARRISGTVVKYRLGETLIEEVAACLLGGHGIPAHIGIAAFNELKAQGAFKSIQTEGDIFAVLSKPLTINGKLIRYRFARQKSKYLCEALLKLNDASPPLQSGRALRDWLLNLSGVGPKTASWIARNWLDADDIAILDIHLLRAGALLGLFDARYSVERNYFELEAKIIEFSKAIGVRMSELDAVIWLEMMSSPMTVRSLLKRA